MIHVKVELSSNYNLNDRTYHNLLGQWVSRTSLASTLGAVQYIERQHVVSFASNWSVENVVWVDPCRVWHAVKPTLPHTQIINHPCYATQSTDSSFVVWHGKYGSSYWLGASMVWRNFKPQTMHLHQMAFCNYSFGSPLWHGLSFGPISSAQ